MILSHRETTHPTPTEFRCVVEPEREWVRVRPVGEVDVATAPTVAEQLDELREAGFERVVLDLSEVSFIDSSGVQLVLRWTQRAQEEGHAVMVVPAPAPAHAVFELAGVAAVVPFERPRGRSGALDE